MARKLYRSRTDSMIAGVCGGLAEYFNIDPTMVRLAAVALTLAGGSGILAYLIFWFVIPQRAIEQSVSESKATESEISDDAPDGEHHTAAIFVGVILVALGFLFLLGNLVSFAWFSFRKLWPLILIAIGALIVMKGSGRKSRES
jgi:phage shock protein C